MNNLQFGLAASLFSILAFTSPLSAQPKFAVKTIQPLSGYQITAIGDMNDRGEALVRMSATPELYEGDSMIRLADGRYLRLPRPYRGNLGATYLNNSRTVVGDVVDDSGVHHFYWTPGAALKFLPLPEGVGFDQYYLEGLNDLGMTIGWAAFIDNEDRGILYDIPNEQLSEKEGYIFGAINNRGSMLRRDLRTDQPDEYHVELVSDRGIFSIDAPPLSTRWFGDLQLNETDLVFGSVQEQDPSDGFIGDGSFCVVWPTPAYQPLRVDPPNMRQRDYCGIPTANRGGTMVVAHSIRIGDDEYRNEFYLKEGATFYNLRTLVPELRSYEYLQFSSMDDAGTIAVTGFGSGSTTRGMILKRVR